MNEPRRRSGPIGAGDSRPEEAALGRTRTVVINGGLHGLLKAKAARAGSKLQTLVETKLMELLDKEELEEVSR